MTDTAASAAPGAIPTACTSITRARLPHARAMAGLIAANHPGAVLEVLLVDDPEVSLSTDEAVAKPPACATAAGAPGEAGRPENRAPLRLWRPRDIGIDDREVHLLACCTTLDELAAVLAPRLAAYLLEAGAASVVVLDPEVVVVAPLDELSLLAAAHGAVVVPRVLGRLPEDGRFPDEVTLGLYGAFDPGIVALSAARAELASWWGARLARAATGDRRLPLDVAQPLLDVLVGDPAVHVLADPAYGLAWWNAHERPVEVTEEGMFLAAGRPLRLAHLQGFDPWLAYLLSADTHPTQRVLLSEHPALAELCRHQAYRLGLAGYPYTVSAPAFEHCADGTPLDERMRRLVRRGLALAGRHNAEGEVAAPPPDPFDPATLAAFYDWLSSGDPASARSTLVPRYLVEVYEDRADLQWAFPRLSSVDALGFRHWAGYHGLGEEVPPALRSHLEACSWWAAPSGVFVPPPSALQDGVTLTGYLRAELGVGEAARLVLDALQGTRFAVSTIPVDLATSRQAHPFRQAGVPLADRRVNVIWLNAEHLLGFAALVSPAFFEGRYNVGGWAWETEHLPAEMAANAAMLDEIWVPSDFVRAAVEPTVDLPVHTFPHPVVPPPLDRWFSPARLGIPEGFFFLFSFDFNSTFERKNPLGVLEAFTRAFGPGEGPTLVLKSVNGDRRPIEHERLLAAVADRPDVVAVDAYLSPGERGALLAGAGCYVSLHRSEGFGLGMAEAMALGRPVIATAYSGNLQFMDESSALLVPAGRTAVGEHAPPYDPAESWADPDLDAAAAAMRAVVEDPAAAAARAERARVRILAEHGRARAVRFLTERLGAIERLDDGGYVSSAAAGLRKLLG